MSNRLAALRGMLATRRLDAVLVTQPEDLHYLADFPDEAASLFITKAAAYILTDFRYVGMVRERCQGFELLEISGALPLEQAVLSLVHASGATRLGFEGHHLTYDTYRALRRSLLTGGRAAAHLVSVPNLVEQIRAIKEPGELAAIERAARLADDAVAHLLEELRGAAAPVLSERQAAWQLERHMRDHGADGAAFDVAVASGPNSAVPHHPSGDRPLGHGEPIWIDIGALVDGYRSDLTRTFCLGESDARYREVYDLVLRAQLAAELVLRPGVTGKAVDAAARDLITKEGYGQSFRHGTGHGVGLAIHELPNLGLRASSTPLAAGNVVTVEPGIYLDGWGGVRIEDLAVVTGTGCRILSTAPK
jgi:Xaa-Pro aminopeptidase